jgi:hypothetical protein
VNPVESSEEAEAEEVLMIANLANLEVAEEAMVVAIHLLVAKEIQEARLHLDYSVEEEEVHLLQAKKMLSDK